MGDTGKNAILMQFHAFSPYIPNPHFYCQSTLQSDMFCDFSVVSIHGKMSVKKLDELQGPLKLRD